MYVFREATNKRNANNSVKYEVAKYITTVT